MLGKDSRQDSGHQEQFLLFEVSRINSSPKSERFVKRRSCAQWRPPPAEISVTEFYYKSVNLSLEELKLMIKILLFLVKELLG